MPSELFYPTNLDLQTVKSLLIMRQLVAEHPHYFEDAPYNQELEMNLLKLLGGPGKATAAISGAVPTTSKGEKLDLLKEITDTYTELKDHRPQASEDAALMTYYRTRSGLLEKLLSAMGEARNQKMVSDFYAAVFQAMEEVMSPAQNTQFIERMKTFKEIASA